jgi:hypothetical protein
MLGLTSPRHIPTLPPDADCQRPIGALPPIGGFFMTAKPDRSKCSTRRFAKRVDLDFAAD